MFVMDLVLQVWKKRDEKEKGDVRILGFGNKMLLILTT
jgi:hypothetical protein